MFGLAALALIVLGEYRLAGLGLVGLVIGGLSPSSDPAQTGCSHLVAIVNEVND
jgi:hypothetical protein